mmetsp:Transcript_18451/g.44393  ORF Transcript_18451/g.44393 Transcript_18451/m.44393 type:complete len:250 (-) Transcript_18451:294-1043(-)
MRQHRAARRLHAEQLLLGGLAGGMGLRKHAADAEGAAGGAAEERAELERAVIVLGPAHPQVCLPPVHHAPFSPHRARVASHQDVPDGAQHVPLLGVSGRFLEVGEEEVAVASLCLLRVPEAREEGPQRAEASLVELHALRPQQLQHPPPKRVAAESHKHRPGARVVECLLCPLENVWVEPRGVWLERHERGQERLHHGLVGVERPPIRPLWSAEQHVVEFKHSQVFKGWHGTRNRNVDLLFWRRGWVES